VGKILFQIVFSVWITLSEHKWIIRAERRGATAGSVNQAAFHHGVDPHKTTSSNSYSRTQNFESRGTVDWQHRAVEADACARFEAMKNQRRPRRVFHGGPFRGQHELALFQQHKIYANP
jgi:hypothetical protein